MHFLLTDGRSLTCWWWCDVCYFAVGSSFQSSRVGLSRVNPLAFTSVFFVIFNLIWVKFIYKLFSFSQKLSEMFLFFVCTLWSKGLSCLVGMDRVQFQVIELLPCINDHEWVLTTAKQTFTTYRLDKSEQPKQKRTWSVTLSTF